MKALVDHILHYYWNPLAERKEDLLNTISPSSYEINLGYLATPKAIKLWAIILKKLYYLVRPTYLGVLAPV